MFSGSMSMDVIVDEGGEIAQYLHWHCIYLAIGEHFTRSHTYEKGHEKQVFSSNVFKPGASNFMLAATYSFSSY